jgi:hypothetical protein
MAGKRGRPKGTGQEINLQAVRALGRYQAMQKEVARKLGMDEHTLGKKLKADKVLQEAFEGGKVDGQIHARQVLWHSIEDHFFTFCTNPACGHIIDDPQKFYARCPECNSKGITEEGEEKNYLPDHHRERGDAKSLDLICKNFLNLTDKVEVAGNKEKPIEVNANVKLSNVSDEDLRSLQAIARRARDKQGTGSKTPS